MVHSLHALVGNYSFHIVHLCCCKLQHSLFDFIGNSVGLQVVACGNMYPNFLMKQMFELHVMFAAALLCEMMLQNLIVPVNMA